MMDLENIERTIGLDHGPEKKMPDSDQIENYYLLVVAIDDYGSNFRRLNNAVRDANNVVEVLTKEYRFDSENGKDENLTYLNETDPAYQNHEKPIPVYADKDLRRTCLYNSLATTTAINKKIKDIKAKMGGKDALLIYFAGHGEYSDNRYYLLCSNSQPKDETTWLMADFIFSPFENYPQDGKCKDLLLVLDACYAGASTLGISVPETKEFSRYILSSASYSEKADDGPIERGSAFALALVDYLQNSASPYLNLTQGRSNLISKFDAYQKDQPKKQTLIIDTMPGKTGQGFFLFERREKGKPKPAHLKESFVRHLNFDDHRSSLRKEYLDDLNHLNIISTHGYSSDMQYLASKITFHWIRELNSGQMKFEPNHCYKESNIRIDGSDEPIRKILYDHLKDRRISVQDTNESIHNYLLEKLDPARDELKGKCHVILWFTFSVGGPKLFNRIDKFCAELSKSFLEKLEGLSGDEKQSLGKMFLFFLDEREDAKKFDKKEFKEFTDGERFNLMPLDPCWEINENHVKEWRNKVISENQSRKIQELTWEKTKDMLAPNHGGVRRCCKYEDFVKKISVYCEYNDRETADLFNQLFTDFETSLI